MAQTLASSLLSPCPSFPSLRGRSLQHPRALPRRQVVARLAVVARLDQDTEAGRETIPGQVRITVLEKRISRGGEAEKLATMASTVGIFLAASDSAQALEGQDVVDTFEKVEAFAQGTAAFLVKAFEVTKTVVETVIRVAKPAIEAAAPVVKDAAVSAFEAATPVVAEGASKAAKYLEEKGVDLDPVFKASQTASEVTSSIISEATMVGGKVEQAVQVAQPAISFLQSQSPPFLAAEAGALVLLYLSFPALLASIAYSFRGYAANLTPAQALDRIISADYTLVDVRTEAEKELSGVPSLPRNAKRKILFVPVEETPGDLRSKLKNPKSLEGELTGIKIASLKKLGKGSKVIVIDSKGDISRVVARTLASLGYRNTFVVQDGVDGTNGWSNGGLPLDFYESPAELLTPAALLSGALGTQKAGGTTKESKGTAKLKSPETRPGLLLPSGRSEGDE